MSGPRSYTQSTLKRLYGCSGNQCAFSDCEQVLVNADNAANSHICHIEAAELGGQRYNPNMNNKERADYSNLIVLCPSHHKVTDDVATYTVEVLQKMKAQHEAMMLRRTRAKRPLNNRPSMLAEIIKKVCSANIDSVETDQQARPFVIEAKIQYNNVIRNKPIIEEHAAYAGKLQKIYIEFEKAGSGNMGIVFRTVAALYAKQKGRILGADTSLENIQHHADDLIEAVQRDLHDLIELSPNAGASFCYEEVEFALSIILVDAFMRCKILEKPQ